MIKRLIFSCVLCLPFILNAQKWEIGVFGGASHYNGDLSEGVVMTEHLHPAVGGFIRYNVNYKWSIRASGYYATISGNDADATDQQNVARNLNFTSPVSELSVIPEFHFTGYKIRHSRYSFSPFVFAGLGIYKFNPQTSITDPITNTTTTYSLQPMRTEGQGSTYNQQVGGPDLYGLTQICVPLGIGVKYALGRNLNFTFELSARKVFTDYLDDVSASYVPENVFYQTSGNIGFQLADRRSELTGQDVPATDLIKPRGNSATNDWYYFSGFTLSYTFFPPVCFKF